MSGTSDARPTAVMFRNLPRKSCARDLVAEVGAYCNVPCVDFVYLPSSSYASNLGYGFVNFISPSAMDAVSAAMHGQTWKFGATGRRIKILPANMHGLIPNLAHCVEKIGPTIEKSLAPLIFVHGRELEYEEAVHLLSTGALSQCLGQPRDAWQGGTWQATAQGQRRVLPRCPRTSNGGLAAARHARTFSRTPGHDSAPIEEGHFSFNNVARPASEYRSMVAFGCPCTPTTEEHMGQLPCHFNGDARCSVRRTEGSAPHVDHDDWRSATPGSQYQRLMDANIENIKEVLRRSTAWSVVTGTVLSF